MNNELQNLPLAKRIAPLSAEQIGVLTTLSKLDFRDFNEADVREEFLVPLIALLGYQRNSDYAVLREESYALNPLFLTVGSKRIKLDYQFNVYKAGFWLLEAKASPCSDLSNPPGLDIDMIGQAHFYAHHREIDCPLFGVSNGWWTNIYDRDSETPTVPILSLFHQDLPRRFIELYKLIGASQVTVWIKRRLLSRITQVLSADIDLARPDEFMRAAHAAAARARPIVLENFRRNAKFVEDSQAREFREFLEESQPYEVLDTLLMSPLNLGSLGTASEILSKKVAMYTGSNQFLFFHKLLVTEPRAVTIDYYVNATHLLARLCHKGELKLVDTRGTGVADTPIERIFVDFVRLLIFHFSQRPDLRVLWSMEALLRRMIKRSLISSQSARKEIAAGVTFERYFKPEQDVAYMGPSPARTLMQVVENVTIAELGAFFARHCTGDRTNEFDVRSAVDEFRSIQQKFEPLEAATNAEYQALIQSLGSAWSELTFIDQLNRSYDRLGYAVCEIVSAHQSLLVAMPDDCRQQFVELARLGNGFARDCAEKLGLNVSEQYDNIERTARLRAMFNVTAT